jgi:hypothetical protein
MGCLPQSLKQDNGPGQSHPEGKAGFIHQQGFQRQTMVNWTLLSMMPALMA